MAAPRLLTLAEAGERLGVGGRTAKGQAEAVRRMVAEGVLHTVNVALPGRAARPRINEDELQEFIKSRTEKTPA
jgi:hypothetical protein